MNKVLLVLLSIFFIGGCTKDQIDDSANVTAGICDITKSSAEVVCLDFTSGSDSNAASTYCSDTLYPIYQASQSANGRAYAASSVGGACVTTDKVGHCVIANGNLNYYSPDFNATTAESDCTSTHSGTWTP